jgi:hypothetical protein
MRYSWCHTGSVPIATTVTPCTVQLPFTRFSHGSQDRSWRATAGFLSMVDICDLNKNGSHTSIQTGLESIFHGMAPRETVSVVHHRSAQLDGKAVRSRLRSSSHDVFRLAVPREIHLLDPSPKGVYRPLICGFRSSQLAGQTRCVAGLLRSLDIGVTLAR